MNLNEYWHILRAHWRAVAALVVAGGVLALAWSLTQPTVYAATSAGFVSAGTGGDPGLESLGDTLAKSRAKSYVILATDRDTAAAVIDNLGLDTTPGALVGSISVTQPTDTVLIQITARAGTPEEAQQLADAWVEALAQRVDEVENKDQKEDTPASTMSIVPSESADLPSAPVSPKPTRNTLIGMMAGGLAGFGYAVVRNQFDRRIRDATQVEKLGAHVVAALPELPSTDPDAPMKLVVADKAGTGSVPASEGFRKLRTNLSYADVDNPPRAIVVTSPNQGDGKSSVAVNLAAAIALNGQPVTLIDGDLRRPRVAKTLGLETEVGLTDVLSGRIPLEAALQEHPDIQGLFALGAGNRPPNPSELLGSHAMRNLIDSLTKHCLVIIDAPPLLPVTDGAVLAQAADGALLVVSTGQTLDTHLEAAIASLRSVNSRLLGVVLNKITKRGTSHGYYEQYVYTYDEDGKRNRSRASSSGSKKRSSGGARKQSSDRS